MPARRVAEAAHGGLRSASSTRRVISRARHPLPAVDARLDPVELGQDVVGEVEPAVGQDVALDPAQDAERRERLVGGGDLLALAADVVGGQPAHGADGRRVVADRDVLVAALAGGAAHLLDARRARRTRSCGSAGRRGCRRARRARGGSPRNGASRSSGGHHGMPSAAYTARLVGRVGQRLERRDVGRASRSRARARCRSAPARPTTSSTGTPSTVTPTRAASPCSITRRSAAARRSARARPPDRPRRTRPRAARTRRASGARRPPGSPLERVRDRADELPRAVEQQPRCGRGSASRASASSSLRLGLRPDAGHVAQPARRRRRAELLRRAHAERPRDLDRALRASARGSGRGRRARARARARARQLGDLAGLDELAQPRLDPRPDPAQLAHPAGRARAPRPAPARRGSSRPPGGTRAACTGSPRRARAASRTRPAGRRSRRCPRRKP